MSGAASPGSGGFEDCGLPNVEGNQPENYVQPYVKGLMQRSTKVSAVLGQLELTPVNQRSETVKMLLGCKSTELVGLQSGYG